MHPLAIAVIAPTTTFDDNHLQQANIRAQELGFEISFLSRKRQGQPSFLNGNKQERLEEMTAVEQLNADAIWCVRGGCGAIELWHDYQAHIYQETTAPLIGYSDITIFHFMRFYRAARIGIHGPIFFDLLKDAHAFVEILGLLINKHAERLTYPALKRLNHFFPTKLSGELLPVNLTSLQSMVGCFDTNFFRGKILAIEDVNEPHYKVFRALHHLKNASLLAGLKALIVGHFNQDRTELIEDTIIPLGNELGIPLFDWPIFGHDQPNWPLLFGAKATITNIDDHFFTLTYDEQHDHTPIQHEPSIKIS